MLNQRDNLRAVSIRYGTQPEWKTNRLAYPTRSKSLSERKGNFANYPTRSAIKLKGVHKARSKGHTYYYAWRGGPRLLGEPNSPEFIASYHTAQGSRFDRLALPGGIRRLRKKSNPDAVQPLIGVYLLLLKGRVVYVGSSLNMPNRVAGHRSNGRPFDRVFFIATAATQREMLERILINAIDPPQNTQYRCRNRTCDCLPQPPSGWP